jgi:hypothetical protein
MLIMRGGTMIVNGTPDSGYNLKQRAIDCYLALIAAFSFDAAT